MTTTAQELEALGEVHRPNDNGASRDVDAVVEHAAGEPDGVDRRSGPLRMR